MLVTQAELKRFAPAVPPQHLAPLVDAINAHLPAIGITERGPRLWHWLGQAAHESSSFSLQRENLSYSAARIAEVFPRVKNPARYAHNPQALAEQVYGPTGANPHLARELGNLKPGDGWRFRGGGLGQLTGGANYAAAGLGQSPESVSEPEVAVESFCFFWHRAGCNARADADDLSGVTRAINGGTTGLAQRRAWTAKARRVFAGAPVEGEVAAPSAHRVAYVQDRLKTLGWNPGAVDGVHGHLSRAAVLSFQDTVGMEPTGDVDDATVAAVDEFDGQRPLTQARTTATVADLRGKSVTVDALDKAKHLVVAAAGASSALAYVQQASDAADAAKAAVANAHNVAATASEAFTFAAGLGDVLAFAGHWWPVLGGVALAAGVLFVLHGAQKTLVVNQREGSRL